MIAPGVPYWPPSSPTARRWLERRGWVLVVSLDCWGFNGQAQMSDLFVTMAVLEYGILVFTRMVREVEKGRREWTREAVQALRG